MSRGNHRIPYSDADMAALDVLARCQIETYKALQELAHQIATVFGIQLPTPHPGQPKRRGRLLAIGAPMMPDANNIENATSDFELDELVGLLGAIYIKEGLSPPFALREAVTSWRGLLVDEIVA
jgi:hypothetical protein